MTTTLLLQIATNRIEREREWGGAAECGDRKEKASGTGRQLLCQVGSSAHYCTSWKTK